MSTMQNVKNTSRNKAFEKCGEITTRGKKEFFLFCSFCEEVYVMLDDFIEHIGREHLNMYEDVDYNDVDEDFDEDIDENISDDYEDITRAYSSKETETGEDVMSDTKEELKFNIEKCEPFQTDGDDDELEEPFMLENLNNESMCIAMVHNEIGNNSNVSKNIGTKKYTNILKDEDEMTIAIIADYKEHPLLWNKKHPYNQNRTRRKTAFQEIVSNINKQFNSKLEWQFLRAQLRKLRNRHFAELRSQKVAESKGEPFDLSWHANQLNFLNPKLKCNHGFGNNDSAAHLETDQSDESDESDSDTGVRNDMKKLKRHNLLKEKDDITMAIIAEYEEQPVLWSNDYPPNQNRAKREIAFRQITINVNKKFDSALKWKNIREQLTNLRKRHYIELQNQKEAELKGKPFTSSWYADKLKFLDPEMKYRGVNSCSEAQFALLSPKLSDVQNINFIQIYKDFPCLWDAQHISYRFQNRRQEALSKMQELIKDELGLSLTQIQLQNKISLIRDTCSQEKKRKIECEHLDEPFEPICHYYEHMTFLEENVSPYRCDVCEELINTYDQYLVHKSSHDGSMPFVCSLCDKGFMGAGNFTVHLRRHTRDYQFVCEICKKRFATSTDVTVHMRQHTGEKPYFCEVCGQSFRTWTFFDRHMRRHQKRAMHTCSICSKPFYGYNKLTEHMKGHLNVRDKVCNVCGKAFTSGANLRQHRQIHAAKKKYVCKICKRDFAQYAGLSGHMKSHGTTLFACGFVDAEVAKRESVGT